MKRVMGDEGRVRSITEIRATGAAWVTEQELTWLCAELEECQRNAEATNDYLYARVRLYRALLEAGSEKGESEAIRAWCSLALDRAANSQSESA